MLLTTFFKWQLVSTSDVILNCTLNLDSWTRKNLVFVSIKMVIADFYQVRRNLLDYFISAGCIDDRVSAGEKNRKCRDKNSPCSELPSANPGYSAEYRIEAIVRCLTTLMKNEPLSMRAGL
jgi:hypothetical protein